MPLYYDSNKNLYPVDTQYLYAAYPGYNIYQPIPDGIFEYEETPQPQAVIDTMYIPDTPALVEGVWLSQWKAIDLTKYSYDSQSQTWYFANPLAKNNNV